MPILHHIDCSNGQVGEKRVAFWCPGCKCAHEVRIAGTAGVWGFNGDIDNPSFTPSIKVEGHNDESKPFVCHSYVTDGKIMFLTDCTHELAGQTVALQES